MFRAGTADPRKPLSNSFAISVEATARQLLTRQEPQENLEKCHPRNHLCIPLADVPSSSFGTSVSVVAKRFGEQSTDRVNAVLKALED